MKNASRFLRGLGVSVALSIPFVSTVAISAQSPGKHDHLSVVTDWSHNHLLFPESKKPGLTTLLQHDARWQHNWYNRHPEAWGVQFRSHYRHNLKKSVRDWNTTLGSAIFEPMFDFNYVLGTTGYGSLNTSDLLDGSFRATAGSLTITSSNQAGTYPLYPYGGSTSSPSGQFLFDNLLFPSQSLTIDHNGLLFLQSSTGLEINIWSNTSPNSYESDSHDSSGYHYDVIGSTFNLNLDPGAGQTSPSKFVFDANAAPSCTNDFVTIGLPSTPASGGQANLVGYNNLYTEPGGTGLCSGTGPSIKYAYASGTGEIPGNVTISQFGTQLAYIENLLTGSSYFHILTLGTAGSNGSSPTAAVVPGVGNNAVDRSVLLSPDSGTTNQSSTTSPFVVYTSNDASDYAFATTYSTASGTSSGYLYKLIGVFGGVSTPRIAWSVPITAVPSSPVYDSVSNKVFFTDNAGRIDYVLNSGTPTVVYGSVVAPGAISANAPVVDSTNQEVYATFNTNGTNALVVQTSTNLTNTVSVPVGTGNNQFGGPYAPDFNNAYYTGVGTPLLYVAGPGSGATPTATLYGVGFTGGALNPSSVQSTALATGLSDSSPVTEFYNSTLNKDFLFVGVTNHCAATNLGGTAGCVESLDITSGFPTVNASTTALAAAGGTTGIVVDNNSSASQASSIYYATKSGSTLVKATQSGLQ